MTLDFVPHDQAVLKQAEVAGMQAAQQPTQPSKLLQESLALGKGYGVAEAWEVRLRFVVGLVAENMAGGSIQEVGVHKRRVTQVD
jgi:hypothetical protein